MLRTHTCGELSKNNTNEEVTLTGWVHRRRDHGKLIFIDIRDRYGITQVVFHPERADAMHTAAQLSRESVITVTGTVVARAPETYNAKLPTGGEYRRSVAVEEFSYGANGKIGLIAQSASGPAANPTPGCK